MGIAHTGKISTIAKFESDTSEASAYIAPESRENLQTFVWQGAHKCRCKISRL